MILEKHKNGLYPIPLYVGISNNLQEVMNNFLCQRTLKIVEVEWGMNGAFCYKNILGKDKKNCILIVFRNDKVIPKTVAHEVSHASKFIWEYLNEETIGDEANAYLCGWLTECVYKTIKKWKTL
jgi:hypothetical protein